MNRLLPLILLMVLGEGPASAVSLAALIAGGQPIQAGNKQFANFSVAQSGVTAAAIDVTAFTDTAGNGGLRFTTAALAINASGSNELIADVFFDVTVTNPGFVIRSVNQAFAASLSAGTITAYDFTSAGTSPALVTPVASNCVNGSLAGCPQNPTPNDSHIFAGSIAFLRVERQIQLLRAKGSSATGSVTSWDTTFADAPSTAGPSPVTVTVATTPPGLSVSVDGVTLAAPQSFSWTPGSGHTIGTTPRQSGPGARFTLANWSDGGAETHTVTALSNATTYTANFTVEYLLATATSPAAGGVVTANPPSADGYYPAGTSVLLSASPAAGYQFGGWTGGLPGNANPQSVVVTGPLSVTANFGAGNTAPVVASVTRGASYLPGAVSPGLIVTVWGDRMGSAQVTTTTPTAEGKFPTALAGTRVLFDGLPGAVLFTSQKQVSVVVPYAVDGKSATQLELEYNGQRSTPYQLAVTDAAPGIFSADATGTGPGAILNVHDDGSVALNTKQEPAPRGSYITVYMTGEGQTNPGGTDGLIAVSVLPRPLLKVAATIGGVPATVQYAGGAAYMVAGAMQVNLLVPQDAPTGPAVPLVIQVGDKPSQSGITVAVGN